MSKKIEVVPINRYRAYGSSVDLTCCVREDRKFIEDYGSTVVVCQSDELESLRRVDDKSVNLSDDSVLLLNSRRLESQDPKFVADILRRRFSERFGSSSPFDGLSDAEIFSAIKSRGIQSMSELDAYSEYLSATLGDSIAAAQARKRSEEAAKALDMVPDEMGD